MLWWHSGLGFGHLYVTIHTLMAVLSLTLFLGVLIARRLRSGDSNRPAAQHRK